jgi:hypothetical protein
MKRARARPAAFGWCLFSVLAASCTRSGPTLVEVEGTARLNGKPLANVQVEYLPEANGPRSLGVTDAQGRYRLASDAQDSGALVGKHRVILHDLSVYSDKSVGTGRDKEEVLKPSRIPGRYASAAQTPLKKEVRTSEKNVLDLDVTSP